MVHCMKSLWCKVIILIVVLLSVPGCSVFRKKKPPEPSPGEQFRLVTDNHRRISLEPPGLGWRRPEKSPFSLMLLRDGSSVQIGFVIQRRPVAQETLLKRALGQLRLIPSTPPTFETWPQDPRFTVASGSGTAVISKREQFSVERAFTAYYHSEKRETVIAVVVGSAEDLAFAANDVEGIISSLKVLK